MNQTSPCAGILIVDKFSSDGTARIAKAFDSTVIQADANRSLARNIGLERCISRGVLFVDSDMILPPNLIEECEEGLRRHQALVVPEVSVGTGFWAECKSMERRTYIGNDLVEAPRCFQKIALLSLGGYNPSLDAGEDWDLYDRVKKSGLSIARVKPEIVHDEGDLTLPVLLRKKYFYGKMIGDYLRLNPSIGIRQINPFRRVLAPTLSILSSDPLHGTGVMTLRTLEFAAAALGLLGGKPTSKASELRRKS